MPSGKIWGHRQKLVHSVGVVGKVQFNTMGFHNYHDFTGIFNGAMNGLIRLSVAVKPKLDESTPFTPGFGLKFLRDGIDSANLVAMFSVDGTPGDWNFFSKTFSNHIPQADTSKLANKLIA